MALIIFSTLFALVLLGILVLFIRQRQIEKDASFLKKHSLALLALEEAKSKHPFFSCEPIEIESVYDNEDYYNSISPTDVLIYRLANDPNSILEERKRIIHNREVWDAFLNDLEKTPAFGEYDVPVNAKKRKRFLKLEKQLYSSSWPKVQKDFIVNVTKRLTTLNGSEIKEETQQFGENEVQSLLRRVRRKSGSFYLDRQIFEAICRVERGKVTNKLRFEIYERDHNRCRKCGSQIHLEIDHIIPISKGGKSTYDNLQTLCHDCNYAKGSNIEEE